MKVNESQLDTLIKYYLVREYVEQGISSMCIKEFLPMMAALLYPYKDVNILVDINSSGIIKSIVNTIKSFTKKTEGLEKYSLEGLRRYFQQKWLPTLDFYSQIKLIQAISLIDKIEDNGFFSIKGNEKVYDSYLHRISVLDISKNYGMEAFEIPEENHQEEIPVDMEDKDIETDNNDRDKEAISLEPLREYLYTNFPLSQYPQGLKQYDYFWEYKINKTQYDRLKEILIGLNFGNNTQILKAKIDGYGTVARVVALFVSEWYKRECGYLDGDRCLESVGLSSGKSGQVWKHAKLPESILHQQEEENQMRQIAMCALGGLPLKYVNNSKRFEEFINGLFKIYQKEEASDEDIKNVVNCFDDNNGIFKRSLESGSCKRYLIQLVQYLKSGDSSDLPFCENDLEVPLFAEFIKKLQEGYDRELPKRYFTSEIRIWTHDKMEEGDDSNLVESEFYVHIGLPKNKNIITAKELTKLGVFLSVNTNNFKLYLEITDNENNVKRSEEFRTYFKIGNGCDDFCGAFGSGIATPIDIFNTQKVSIWLESGDYRKEIYTYSLPQYLELYSTDDYFLWITSKNNAARKVLLYNKEIYTPQDLEESVIQTKSIDKKEWGWIYLKCIITIVDNNGNEILIEIGQSETIVVDFKTNRLSKDFELLGDGCVKSVIDGNEENGVHLLYYSSKGQLILTCDGIKDKELWKQYEIWYKSINDDIRYTLWGDKNPPKQGFIKLRIRCRDVSKKKRDWTGTVYFIGEVMPNKWRNLDNNFIYLIGDNISPEDDSLTDLLNVRDRKIKDSSQYKPEDKTIPFRIGNVENHIIIKVYRAFNWREVWNGDKLIKNVLETTAPSPVAIILQNNIKIITVDENGYSEYSPQTFEYLNYFDNPRLVSNKFIVNSSESFSSYIYLSSFEDGEKTRKIENNGDSVFLYVSDKHIDKYDLYYWSGLINDIPVKLDREYIESRKYKYSIPSKLTEKAIVFQSLKERTPNLYFRPFYDDEWKWDHYVNRYNTSSIDYVLRCYQLAVEHNVYFCIFPAIRVLQERDEFTNFIRAFILQKKFHLTTKDVENLTRLAKELAMDWFFVNRKKLFEKFDCDNKKNLRECMSVLLRHSPILQGEKYYSSKFIDKFLQNHKPFNQRNGKLARQFLNFFDDSKNFAKYYNGTNNVDNRIDFLSKLVNTKDNLFIEICRILNI